MNNYPKVPVFMYHSVGVPDKTWRNNYLTCPYWVFENVLKWLKRYNYSTITFQQLYDYISHEKPIPKKSIILTFDDGYLDNYVFAYPLLKKHGFKGCIFPSTDFITNGEPRKKLDDVKNISALDYTGYLYWSELIEMENSGVMEIQCHAKTHTFFETSNKLVDFRHDGDSYYWFTWNEYPEKKPFLIKENLEQIIIGQPIFEFKPSLSSQRFFINEDVKKDLRNYVIENNLHTNYSAEKLERLQDYYVKKYYLKVIGRKETNAEYEERILHELQTSKELLEQKLNKEIIMLCWPHGSATSVGVDIARKIGFKLNTAGRDILKRRHLITNSPLHKTDRIYRLPVSGFWNKQHFQETKTSYLRGCGIVIRIKLYKTKCGLYKIVLKIIHKLIYNYHKIKTI